MNIERAEAMLSETVSEVQPFNRVPQVTPSFWVVKLLAVTVGETAADYLAVNLGYGLVLTTWFMSAALIAALAVQFAQKRYVPWAYWLTVVLISVVGTLVTDNMVDNLGIELPTTTTVSTIILAAVFLVWYQVERSEERRVGKECRSRWSTDD